MAPLHHHYELKGWKENQVVVRFGSHHDAGAVGTVDVEAAVNMNKRARNNLVSVQANLLGKVKAERRPEPKPGCGALLDHHHDAGACGTVDVEAALMEMRGKRVLVLGSEKPASRWRAGSRVRVRVSALRSRESPPNSERLAREAPDVLLDTGPFRAASSRART